MEIQKDLAFPIEEYLTRLSAIRSRMAGLEIDALLVPSPENICYLAGYQTPGYYFPQTLVVTHNRDPQIVIRRFEGGNVDAIMGLTYGDGGWPGPGGVGRGVGYLLMELMISQRPLPFVRWVNAVKSGKEWEQALVEDFGTSRAALIQTFVQYYRVND